MSNATNRPTSPRRTDKNGKIWVTRSVVGGRRVPGWRAVDPLTLPFHERGSVRVKLARLGYASDETPTWARAI